MVWLEESGAATKDVATTAAANPHRIALGDGFVTVDVHTWNEVRRSARPIDLDLQVPPVFSSDAARYQEFRSFVGATEGVPRWRGLAANMYLHRDFEALLLEAATSALAHRELPSPIVLAGQTASGKSIALAAIAVELARSGDYAVLHQSRRTVRPSVEDLDMFAAWAEDQGARATILIWDGMVDPGEYEALSRQLHARGRKFLVIGSAYRSESATSTIIEAPIDLSPVETDALVTLLDSFGIPASRPQGLLDTSFLALLYRTLPETERQLRGGLAREMRAAEKSMAKLARERRDEDSDSQRLTSMQEAFLAAGLGWRDLLPEKVDTIAIREQAFSDRAPIQKVTTLVLVAGKHGVPVPLDLALRILGHEGSQSVRDALSASDIIREIDDDNGDFFLGVRSHLEADLLAREEVPLEVEIEVVGQAIRNVRVTDGFSGGADEVQFLVSLLERIGPTSERSQYRPHFGTVAGALRARREESGRSIPRLVLQESAFTRGDVHWRQNAQRGTSEERVTDLEYNREVLDDVLADPATRGLMRLSLAVELASTLGAIIYEHTKSPNHEKLNGLGHRLDDVLHAVLDARSIDPGNVYPIDVLAWSTELAVEAGTLSPSERLDVLANAVATLESIDRASLNDRQLAGLDKRGVELQKLLGRDDEVFAYLDSLKGNLDPAATFFLAQFDAKEGPEGERKALELLRNSHQAVRTDWRCAQLMLDLTWKSIADERLLPRDRALIHLNESEIDLVRLLASEIEDAGLPDIYRLRFAQAIAEFSAGNFPEASRHFREVGDLTRQLSRRIYTAYVLASDSMEPETFTGRVESSDGRSGLVWVNELSTRVKFEPRLFSTTGEFARGQQLPAFHIGFKLSRGAVAEPRSALRRQART